MNRDNIRSPKQRFFRNQSSPPILFRLFTCQILAPRDDAHPERLSNFCDPRTDIAQSDDPERLTIQVITYRQLPAAASYGHVFGGKVAQERVDQCPSQF